MDKKNHKAEKNSAENQNENKAQEPVAGLERGIEIPKYVLHRAEGLRILEERKTGRRVSRHREDD